VVMKPRNSKPVIYREVIGATHQPSWPHLATIPGVGLHNHRLY
jgi:hypothetical protein